MSSLTKLRKYIDIGANLTDLMYTGVYNGTKKHDNDLEHVLQRSWKFGLEKMIITAGNYEESKVALDLANKDDRLYSTVGCHPTRCLEFEKENSPTEYLDLLRRVIEDGKSKVVAIGECGLDYDRVQFCPIDIQKKYFELQLSLSQEFKLPLFLHCRNAAEDLYSILSKYKLHGVVHSFDGTIEEAMRFIELGYYIGLNGCSLKTKENLETVASLPSDRILLETDCPWCEIRPSHAGYQYILKEHQCISTKKEKWQADFMVKSRNEPSNIRQVFDVVSKIRSDDPDTLSNIIYENTLNLFFNLK
ncbi:TatD related DNase [Popillia japonica]|uniref:Deoxyribonuclease TATDN1 n=1 Tax=Popillia japonica TaxID=7064 RepID=A0AAW1LT10_POPJA